VTSAWAERALPVGITPWSEAQMAKVNEQADIVYADFTPKWPKGRKLPMDRVRKSRAARVWTAPMRSNADWSMSVGGFWTAVDDAKMLAGIDAGTRVRFKSYPDVGRRLRRGLASARDVVGVAQSAAGSSRLMDAERSVR
jgi:ClpP class serine protease